MALTRIHHVAVIVRDADAALSFYRDALDVRVTKDKILTDQGVRAILLGLPNSEIELIQPVEPDTGVARFLETRGEGFHHICFESSDVAAELRGGVAAGMRLIDETPRQGLAGMIGFVHPKSNHGVLVEYVQLPEPEAPVTPGTGPASPIRMRHIAIGVPELDGPAQTFCSHFGMQEVSRSDQPQFGVHTLVLALGDPQVETLIEMVTPATDDADHLLNRRMAEGGGLFMLALDVKDVDVAVQHLRARGITCTDPTSGPGKGTWLDPEFTNGARLFLGEER